MSISDDYRRVQDAIEDLPKSQIGEPDFRRRAREALERIWSAYIAAIAQAKGGKEEAHAE